MRRTAALQAFLEAQAVYGSDLKAISADRYSPQLLRGTLEACGIQGTEVYRAPYDPEEPGYVRKLREFHRDCYRRGLVSACFTSMELVRESLLAEGIPAFLAPPAAILLGADGAVSCAALRRAGDTDVLKWYAP